MVTNPPFSLFREYVAQLVEHDKKFLIIGNQNAIHYKGIFPLIKENKVWLGHKAGDMAFKVPEDYEERAFRHWEDETGQKWRSLGNVCWFTNLEHKKRHEPLDLYKHYTPEEYPTYDNFDAIEVSKTADIPMDYPGTMGVPITFLDKYCPEQFEIVSTTQSWAGGRTKTYGMQTQVSKDGKQSNVMKLNDSAALEIQQPIHGTYYIVDGKKYVSTYARILIRKKP